MHEARFYERSGDDVLCMLCGQLCRIAPGSFGLCGVRVNRDGTLRTDVYGKVAAGHVDPVEKKPLFHVYPGSRALSVATVGCNFRCEFCQNWDLSQASKGLKRDIRGSEMSPEDIARAAVDSRCRVVAFTYSEPTIFYEWAYDVATLTAERRIVNAFVTNGYMSEAPLREIAPRLHAANVDLKAFSDETYIRTLGASKGIGPVLDTLRLMKELRIWVEVTTLVVPGMNDSDEELTEIAEFIAGDLGAETPWHVSRFHPDYQYLDAPVTPVSTLKRAYQIGERAGLRHVYVGNVIGEGGEDTVCGTCGALLVHRSGYTIRADRITPDGRCPKCGAPVPGLGMGADPELPVE